MFPLILDVTLLAALLFVIINLESCPPRHNFSRGRSDCTGMVSRYLIMALVAFPGIALTRVRAAERGLQRVGMKLLSYAGLFSGRPYLSEILLSAVISIILLGSLAVRRSTRRLFRHAVKPMAASVGDESLS